MTTLAMMKGIDRRAVAAKLAEARARTLLLVHPLTDAELRLQHDPLMSPIIWDLGHIAHFEELWLTRNLEGPVEFVEMPGLFNPFEHPRSERGRLRLPTFAECREVMSEIRSRVLERLEETEFDEANPLLRQGYVYQMVLQHEYQHNETMLQTLQLKQGSPYTPLERSASRMDRAEIPRDMLRFPGGSLEIGTNDRSSAYDNERPRHRVELSPFWIDRAPVTNADFADFIEAGGYSTRAYWSDAGWAWAKQSGARSPMYWTQSGDGWDSRSMDRSGPIEPDHPVCHVSYYEAEAYARYAGKRLPTEFEWEAAASWSPSGSRLNYPWGEEPPTSDLANLDQLAFGTRAVGSYP
ncbi:MAG TPA: SUMF1/EgtB/PvdO family nonheme iron enzyme, partial [Gemmatimonadales bacterium]|nr:SUMF1/EgtB/PvdO family nonheme iron enzyme [Gemmatimonadales bacterium]